MPHLAPFSARCLGFVAALLLAVAGWLGGAFPHGDLAATPVTVARGPAGPIILCCWVLGTVAGSYAWWSLRDRVPSPRWALGTAAMWAAPFLVVPAMGSRDVYSYACQGFLYVHGLNPYESGVASLPCPWIEGVSPIWRDTAAPYGPLFLLLGGLVTLLAGDSLTLVLVLFRLIALAGLGLVVAGLPVIARRCGVPVRRALWIALAGPLTGAHLLAGPHNDAVMIGLVVAGLAVGARGRALNAGLLLGLAVGVKVTAVGMTLTYLGRLFVPGFDAVPVARGLALIVLVAVVAVLWWRGWTTRDVPVVLRGAALSLAAFVALSPYFHPWYAIWALVPLAATTLHTDLVMAAATAASLLVLPDGSGLARFAKFPGAPLMTVLLVILLVRRVPRSPAAEHGVHVGGDQTAEGDRQRQERRPEGHEVAG